MDNDMMERKVDCDYISQTRVEKEYVAVAVVVGVARVGVTGETGVVVGLGGNCGIGVCLVRYK